MKILARILLVILMACPLLAFAQQMPLFQFIIYFEDSIGNRDSVILGYDPNASTQNIDPQFGEIVLTSPFDSIFEVRAMHFDDTNERTLKKVIVDFDTAFICEIDIPAKIIINAKFPPVKITYDSTLFPINTCANVVLSPDKKMFFIPEWWNVCDYHCMAGASEYVEDFVIPAPVSTCWNRLYVEKEVEGQGVKTLPGLFLITFFGPGPCNDPTFLSVKNEVDFGFGILTPNPVSEQASIQVPSEAGIQATVIDVTGKLISCPFEISNSSAQFEVSQLSAGLYFVLLRTGDGRQAVYKFVKL